VVILIIQTEGGAMRILRYAIVRAGSDDNWKLSSEDSRLFISNDEAIEAMLKLREISNKEPWYTQEFYSVVGVAVEILESVEL